MNIIEATKKALEKGVGIANAKAKRHDLYLLPTNTNECYIVVPNNYSADKSSRVTVRWNPMAEDILGEDWELVKES